MSDAPLAAGFDRLPWLADEPRPQPAERGSSELAAWAVAATVLVAGASYWIGVHSSDQPAFSIQPARAPATTVRLPPAEQIRPEVKLRPVAEVQPVTPPRMPVIDQPRPVAPPAPSPAARVHVEVPEQPADAEPVRVDPLRPWPARVLKGASGRLVRIGAFANPHQAKRGWWGIVRLNPALQRLPAVVVPVQSLRNGQVYYRIQMGTTSQAHSQILCQRMRMVALSCVVVDGAPASAGGAP